VFDRWMETHMQARVTSTDRSYGFTVFVVSAVFVLGIVALKDGPAVAAALGSVVLAYGFVADRLGVFAGADANDLRMGDRLEAASRVMQRLDTIADDDRTPLGGGLTAVGAAHPAPAGAQVPSVADQAA